MYARICRFATTKPLRLLHCGEFQVNLAYLQSWQEILLYWNAPRRAKRASLLHDMFLLVTRSSSRSPLRRKSIIAICAGIPCIRKLKAKILISRFRRVFAENSQRVTPFRSLSTGRLLSLRSEFSKAFLRCSGWIFLRGHLRSTRQPEYHCLPPTESFRPRQSPQEMEFQELPQ